MIKVNLLKDQTTRARKAVVKPAASPMLLMVLATLALVAGGLGAAWYYLHNEIVVHTASRNRLRVEFARMQELRKEIDKYDKLKRERQNRIDIIEQLKANQKGPVLLLNHVIQSIPTGISFWLTSLDQKGDQIRITGYTLHGESVPDFMSNLAATGYFRTVDLELYEDKDNKDKEAAKFTLLCIAEQRKATPE